MHLDEPLCLCFRVTRRKLEAFVRVERPSRASLMGECGGAGTGCGWCVPHLVRLHERVLAGAAADVLDGIDAADYAAGRAEYRAATLAADPADRSQT